MTLLVIINRDSAVFVCNQLQFCNWTRPYMFLKVVHGNLELCYFYLMSADNIEGVGMMVLINFVLPSFRRLQLFPCRGHDLTALQV